MLGNKTEVWEWGLDWDLCCLGLIGDIFQFFRHFWGFAFAFSVWPPPLLHIHTVSNSLPSLTEPKTPKIPSTTFFKGGSHGKNGKKKASGKKCFSLVTDCGD